MHVANKWDAINWVQRKYESDVLIDACVEQ